MPVVLAATSWQEIIVRLSAESASVARFRALGSEIVVAVTDAGRLAGVVAHVRAWVDAVDLALSRLRPDSELARLEARPGRPQPASALFLDALDLACQAAARTEGWFDPTVRDAVEAAGYDRGIERTEREEPGPAGRWHEIAYDRQARTVLLPRGVRLDFGGIGKGFAVDRALSDLADAGIGVLVSAGGDLAVAGPAPGDGWACGVSVRPEDPAETVVLLRAGALATWGLGRRRRSRRRRRLHHLINPRSGAPASSPWHIVTVAAPNCVEAGVAARVGWLRGAHGPTWLESLGLAGRFRGQDGQVVTVGPWPVEHAEE